MVHKEYSDIDGGGVLRIFCKNTLTVHEDGVVSASQEGLSSKYIYKEEKQDTDSLYFGWAKQDGLGGGIIELIANNIINYGKIEANGASRYSYDDNDIFGSGHGGSIKFQCNTFINRGIIEAKEINKRSHMHGKIIICCEKYINEGTIVPAPDINDTIVYNDKIIHFTNIADEITEKLELENDEEKTNTISDTVNKTTVHCVNTNQDKFYETFYQPKSVIYQYKLKQLFINSELNISKENKDSLQIWCTDKLVLTERGKMCCYDNDAVMINNDNNNNNNNN
eukprot:525578_1